MRRSLEGGLSLGELCARFSLTLLGARGASAITARRVTTHSAEVEPGDIFLPLTGHRTSGERYINEAIGRGAVALLLDRDQSIPQNFPCLISDNPRKIGAEIQNCFLGDPLSKLRFVGITGTKGKSSTLLMLDALLRFAGHSPLSIGTLGMQSDAFFAVTKNTTPDLFFLLPYLARFVEAGGDTVLLEISSQALADGRLLGLRIPLALFTGLSPDHIGRSEHRTLRDYFLAKRSLFEGYGVRESIAPFSSLASFGMTRGVERRLFTSTVYPSDLTLRPISYGIDGTRFSCGNTEGYLSAAGSYQLENAALATLAASRLLDCAPTRLLPALSGVSLCGRFERYEIDGRLFVIDYAHNGASLRAVATHARSFTAGRLFLLFGAVGGRGECRRRELVSVAESLGDHLILTEDDSGCEDRESILAELLSYVRSPDRVTAVPDRAEAIRVAYDLSRRGDTILLLGKGHERFLVRDGERIPFSEREILKSLGRRRARSGCEPQGK